MHEGAHGLCARVLGARRIRFRLLADRRLSPRVEIELDETRPFAAMLFYAAGPLGNLIVALGLLALAWAADTQSAPLVIGGALHALYGALNLLPFGEGSDGRELWARLRTRT